MNRATVLMYHSIGTPPAGARMRGLYVRPAMFRFQMWYLRAAGFRVVPLDEIGRFTAGGRSGERLAAITFDDGFQDFDDHARPVLREFGYPATIFIVSDLIGRTNEWDRESLGVTKPLMDRDTIIRLRDEGVAFGSHTRTHPFLTKLDASAVEAEVRTSKEDLEALLGAPVSFFCYPYGDHDARSVDAVRRAGYRGAVTTRRGFVLPGDDPFVIRRVPVSRNTHPFSFIWKLHTDYETRKGGGR